MVHPNQIIKKYAVDLGTGGIKKGSHAEFCVAPIMSINI